MRMDKIQIQAEGLGKSMVKTPVSGRWTGYTLPLRVDFYSFYFPGMVLKQKSIHRVVG